MSKGILVLVQLVMLPVILVVNGFTLSVLWQWFIANKFGLPPLSIAEALGVALVVSCLLPSAKSDWPGEDASDEEKVAAYLIVPFLKAAIFLFCGLILHQFA